MALLSRSEAGATYPGLSAFTGLAMSAVHAALERAEAARLWLFEETQPRVLRSALREFLLHGAPNVGSVEIVAAALGELRDERVRVGGGAASLLIDAPPPPMAAAAPMG